MSKPQLKAGLLGSGFAASFHFEALKRVYSVEVELVGAYSPTRENRDRFAKERGIRAFSSMEELIEEADVIHACVPPSAHEAAAVACLEAGKSVIVEKPFTGYFGDGTDSFNGDTFDRETGLEEAMRSVCAIRDAEVAAQKRALDIAERGGSGVPGPWLKPRVFYAENWVYAPAIQKEREILEKTGGQILWIHGEEAHHGSHSKFYGIWKFSGGGSIMGKSVHPLTAALYLKKVEGRARNGRPIRPATVSARTHAITRDPRFQDAGYLRTTYTDIEDFGAVHVTFEDGTFADIFASELVLGGVHNWLEVNANNHRAVCNINPNSSMQTYNPKGSQFDDIYVVEKIGTKEGWAFTSPDEEWFTGYQHEMEAFYRAAAEGTAPESDTQLGADTIAAVYAAYLSAARKGQEAEVPLI
ncbi:MAG: Gfo/Idh/MocA family protein [Spirochaetaceae bacterium]